MAKKIGMGVIGLGGIANAVHIPGINNSPDAQLVAICDIDEKKLKERQAQYGIDDAHAFTDYRDLMSCPDVDAVDICTPNDMHVPIAMEAARRKLPFAVEKPLGINRAETEELYELVKQNNVPNMICFSYRFKAAARYARDLIQQGKLGKIYHVYARYLQAWSGPNCGMAWRFQKVHTGSGALGDLGAHMLDLVRFMTGEDYVRVVADNGTFIHERKSNDPANPDVMLPVDVDDYSHYFATTESGIATSFEISRFGYGRGNYQRVEVYGEKGALVYELEREDTLDICIGDVYKSQNLFTRTPIPWHYYTDQMQTFMNIVNGRDNGNAAHIEDGHRNQILLDAILESGEQGKAIVISK